MKSSCKKLNIDINDCFTFWIFWCLPLVLSWHSSRSVAGGMTGACSRLVLVSSYTRPPGPPGYKSVSVIIGDSRPWLIIWSDPTNKVETTKNRNPPKHLSN